MLPLWRFTIQGRGAGVDLRAVDAEDAVKKLRSVRTLRRVKILEGPIRVVEADATKVVRLHDVVAARHNEASSGGGYGS
jgi:hypothetical protein